jgi:hypothetical protein
MARFNYGSTVIMLFPAGAVALDAIASESPTRLGRASAGSSALKVRRAKLAHGHQGQHPGLPDGRASLRLLAERHARDLVLDPVDPMLPGLYGPRWRWAFRRSGSHVYRPHCAACQACTPVRIPVERFRPAARSAAAWNATPTCA